MDPDAASRQPRAQRVLVGHRAPGLDAGHLRAGRPGRPPRGRVHRAPGLHGLGRRGPRQPRRPGRPAPGQPAADRRRGLHGLDRRVPRPLPRAARGLGGRGRRAPPVRRQRRPAPGRRARGPHPGLAALAHRRRPADRGQPHADPVRGRRHHAPLPDRDGADGPGQRRVPGAGPRGLPPPLLARRPGPVRRATVRGRVPRGLPGPRRDRPSAGGQHHSPLASVELVRWFGDEGGEAISFGSDAHTPTAVGQRFDLAVDVVEAAGFRPGRDRFDFWRR